MRQFSFFLTFVMVLGFSGLSSAQNNCGAAGFAGTNCQDNDTTTITDNFSPSANSNATGVGVGMGFAEGGDATSVSRAAGGDAAAGAVSGSGVFDSGNSRNTNRNLNDSNFGNSASLAGAGVFDSGNSTASVGPVGNNSGNSSSDSSASAFGQQGQQQGQVGIQGQLGILDNEVTTGAVDASSSNSNRTSTSTTTSNDIRDGDVTDNSNTELNVEGDSINYDAPDIPVNSAAPVFAGACSQGVSIQTQSFGGSAGSSNPVCDYVAVAGGFVAAGERDEAVRVLGKAEDAADWRFVFSQIRNVLTLGLL